MPYPGQPKDTPIPAKLDRWNWGAFFLHWIWGLGNSTYIALLMFVPLVNIVMVFVLGAKGSKWAWKNRLWEDEAHFITTQRNWAWGAVAAYAGVFLVFGSLFFGLSAIMKNSEAYKMTMVQVRSDSQIIEAMGEPIETGFFIMGSINLKNSDGSANLSIPISGPKCSGTAYTEATKKFGAWTINLLVVRLECQNTPIILINRNNLRVPGGTLSS